MYYSCAGSRSRGVKIRASSLRSNTYFSPGSIFNSSMSSGVKTIHPAFVTSTIRIPQYSKKTGKLYSSWVAGNARESFCDFGIGLRHFEKVLSLPRDVCKLCRKLLNYFLLRVTTRQESKDSLSKHSKIDIVFK